MFSATITEESLVDLRDLFRGYEAFHSGKRQKLSNIDNLFALALGYQRGYGNLVAAVRAGGYIFSVNAVDPMSLAKYEAANISCVCGIDAYLLIYEYMGASAYSVMELCRTYLLFKMVYSAWVDLTSPENWERQGNILHSMLERSGKNIQRDDKKRFQYLSGVGLWPLWELENLSLAKLGLSEHQPLADTLFQRVQNEGRMSYLYQFDPLEVYKPHLKKIFGKTELSVIAKILLSELADVFWRSHVFDIRGYCLWFFYAHKDFMLETPATAELPEQHIYLCKNNLVLKENCIWVTVVLTEADESLIRKSFASENRQKTRELITRLWNKHKARSSSTWSEQLTWRDTIPMVEHAFLVSRYTKSSCIPLSIQHALMEM